MSGNDQLCGGGAEARLQKAAAYFLPSSSDSDDDSGAASDGRAAYTPGQARHAAPRKKHKRKREQ